MCPWLLRLRRLILGLFWAIPCRGMALKRPCPNRRPVKFAAGLKFKPAEILLKFCFTVVSRAKMVKKRQTLLYRDSRNAAKFEKVLTIVIPRH